MAEVKDPSVREVKDSSVLLEVREKLSRVKESRAREEELAAAQSEVSPKDKAKLKAILHELDQVMIQGETLTKELNQIVPDLEQQIKLLQTKIKTSKGRRVENSALLQELLELSEQIQEALTEAEEQGEGPEEEEPEGDGAEEEGFDGPVTASAGCIQLDPPCSYNVSVNNGQAFPVKDGLIPAKKLSGGVVKVTVMTNTVPPLPVGTFEAKKNEAITLPVTQVQATWKLKDAPLPEAQVSGVFHQSGSSTGVQVASTTSSSGVCSLGLPPGTLSKMKAVKGDTTLENRGNIVVPEAQQGAKGKKIPLKTAVNIGASHFDIAAKSTDYTIVLGDVSGSMSAGNQMKILKDSLLRCFDNVVAKKGHVAMMCWDTSPYWMQTRWLTAADRTAVTAWINQQKPRGGNDMKQAILDAITRFPQATDIFTMCDGDVTPFDVGSWDNFQKSYPRIHFHFIALGRSADPVMQAMAASGRGNYEEVV